MLGDGTHTCKLQLVICEGHRIERFIELPSYVSLLQILWTPRVSPASLIKHNADTFYIIGHGSKKKPEAT